MEGWKNRAQTLGLFLPDPTILVKAVAGITAGVFDKGQNSEMALWVSGPFVAPGGFQAGYVVALENARPQSTSQRIAQQRPMMQERGKERVRTVRGIRPRTDPYTRTTRTRKVTLPLPTRP